MKVEQSALQTVHGRRSGFWNLVNKECQEWLLSRTWLVHITVWLAVVSGVPAVVALVSVSRGSSPAEVNGLGALLFFIMSQLAAVIAVVVRTQGAIVGEKRNGTAEWILSKPVSRKAFVLSKLVAHLIWLLIVTLLLPGIVLYLLMYLITGDLLPFLPFLGGVGMMALSLLFYLTLSLFLGTVFESRGPLAGIIFGFMVTGFALTHFNVPLSVTSIFPWLLFEFGRFLVSGDHLPTTALISIVATTAWAVAFVALALSRFEHVQF
jgi:ABC-2 type transport system permease protein